MDRKIGIYSMLAIVFIFGIYGTAWAGGGKWEDYCPSPLPAPPYSGPEIDGVFTAARDGGRYHIQVVLQRGNAVHSLHYTDAGKPLCKYTEAELIELHRGDACREKVGEMFGLSGVPVMETLKITSQENCGDGKKEIISGKVKIRVVPIR